MKSFFLKNFITPILPLNVPLHEKELAIENFKKSIELNPQNTYAADRIKREIILIIAFKFPQRHIVYKTYKT